MPNEETKRTRTKIDHYPLPVGTRLRATLKGTAFSARLVEDENGERQIEFRRKRYPTLSAAGRAAAGYPVNGWKFWRVVGPRRKAESDAK